MIDITTKRDQLPMQAGSFFTPQMTDTVFWRPRFMTDTPLMQHAPFLFWLVRTVRPKNVAMFGSGDGTALFALCQAMDKLNIAGRCLGVGFWDDGLPDDLRDHADMLYDDLLLWRADTDPRQAMGAVAQGSLDLLFVDAASIPTENRPDMAEWQALLQSGGILIVHGQLDDTGEENLALQAVTEGRPVISFPEGDGLVVLPLDAEAQPAALQGLLQAGSHGLLPREISLFFRRLGQAHLALAQLTRAEADNDTLREANLDASSRITKLEAKLAKANDDLALESRTRFTETAALTRQLETMRHAGKAKVAPPVVAPPSEKLSKDAELIRKTNAQLRKQLEALRKTPAPAAGPAFKQLQQEVETLRAENAMLHARVADLMASTSWRVTAPMRKVKSIFSRD